MTPRPERWLPGLLLVIALVASFSPLLTRAPHGEDARVLARLEQIDGLAGTRRTFTHPHWSAPLPLAALFLRAQTWLFHDARVTPFMAVSLILHALNVLLLLSLLRRSGVGPWAAGIIAGAFALHPIQVENVARVAAQGELLALGCVLLGLHLRDRAGLRVEFALLALLVVGALCSPTALLMAPLLVLLAPDRRAALGARIPQLVATLLLGILLWTRTLHELAVYNRLYTFGEHLHHFGAAMLFSLMDLTGPYGLSPMHVVPAPIPKWVPPTVLAPIVLVVWAGARRTQTGRPAAVMCLVLLFAAMRGILHFEYRADGWLALAVVGLAWLLVARFGRPGRFPRVVGITVLTFWAVMAHAQAGTWRNERVLLDHAIEVQTDNWQARTARAELAMLEGDVESIEPDAVAALVAQPRSVAAAFLLGSARGLTGDEFGARRMGWHGARTGWNDDDAETRLGYVFLELGLDAEALTILGRTDTPEAEAGLALALARTGDEEGARFHRDRALERAPETEPALAALTWLLATAPEDRLADPERAVALADSIETPEFRFVALDARATALARLGRFADAYRDAQDAARRAETEGYLARADEIRARALVYLGSGTWTEPRGSAPAANTEVHEDRDEDDDGRRDPGDR